MKNVCALLYRVSNKANMFAQIVLRNHFFTNTNTVFCFLKVLALGLIFVPIRIDDSLLDRFSATLALNTFNPPFS